MKFYSPSNVLNVLFDVAGLSEGWEDRVDVSKSSLPRSANQVAVNCFSPFLESLPWLSNTCRLLSRTSKSEVPPCPSTHASTTTQV